MNMTNQQYASYVKQKAPASPIAKNMALAFLIGGAICTVGQAFRHLYFSLGMDIDSTSAATSITMIFLGAFFTGLKLYDHLAKYGGAGTLIPITGFANAVVSPAMEFKSEGIITGLCAKMFVIAGPVLVFSTVGSFVYGLCYLLITRLG